MLDRNHLASIAACLWAKSEKRSRNFANEFPNSMLTRPAQSWSLSVTIGDKTVTCQLQQLDGSFMVLFPTDAFFFLRWGKLFLISSIWMQVILDGKSFALPDSFNLSVPVIKTQVNNAAHTVQLIKSNAAGVFRIRYISKFACFCLLCLLISYMNRYKGTPFDVKVIKTKVEHYENIMPEKPKVTFFLLDQLFLRGCNST